MKVSASRLNRKQTRDHLENIVKEWIRVIDDRIVVAHTSGYDNVVIDLPTIFGVDDLCKSDTQTIVYSRILDVYGKPEPGGRGFAVNFRVFGDERAQIKIAWSNGLSADEREKMQAVIRSYTLPAAK